MATRAFLDCSGKKEDSFVTLAAFYASDSVWREFKHGWNAILDSAFTSVPYMHMVDAIGLREKGPFKKSLGWTHAHVWRLVFRLVTHMSQFKADRLKMHSCVVNMDAWRRIQGQGIRIPSEVELCNRYVSEFIVARFAELVLRENGDREVIEIHSRDLLHFAFDRSESFREPFANYVGDKKAIAAESGRNSIWQFVDGIEECDMKTTPGIQAADMFAWGTNRENTRVLGTDGTRLAEMMRQLVASACKEYDEPALRYEFDGRTPRVW